MNIECRISNSCLRGCETSLKKQSQIVAFGRWVAHEAAWEGWIPASAGMTMEQMTARGSRKCYLKEQSQ